MDDDRTRRTLDTLADLFLTGTAPSEASPLTHTNPSASPSDEAPAPLQMPTPDSVRASALPDPIQPSSGIHQLRQPFKLQPTLRANAPAKPAGHAANEPDGAPASVSGISSHASGGVGLKTPPRKPRPESTSAASERRGARPSLAPRQAAPAPTAPRSRVLGIVLGNLPGLAGPWLTQYAQTLADRDAGTVLILHRDADELALDLVDPVGQRHGPVPDPTPPGNAATVRRWILDRTRASLPIDLPGDPNAMLTDGTAPIRHVLVRIDPAQINEVEAFRPDGWIFLTGADEAAIAAARLGLEKINALDGQKTGQKPGQKTAQKTALNPGHQTPSAETTGTGLVIVGAEDAIARHAAQRLIEDSQSLRHPAYLALTHRRVAPTRLTPITSFPAKACGWNDIARDLSALALSDQARPNHPTPSTPPAASLDPQAAAPPNSEPDMTPYSSIAPTRVPPAANGHVDEQPAHPAGHAHAEAAEAYAQAIHHEPDPMHDPQPQPQPRPDEELGYEPAHAFAPEHSTGHAPHLAPESMPEAPRPSAPAPAAAHSFDRPPPTPAAQRPLETTLSALMTRTGGSLTGAITLEARCPDHPEVEFLLDAQGQLHLLATHADSDPTTFGAQPASANRDPGALRDTMIDLLEARRWARRHRDLIALTQRQLRMNLDVEPQLHLFTPHADIATGLIGRLGDALKLHLLAPVTVGQATGWFTTPLN